MGDFLTSGDLGVGHNDLVQPMLVDPIEVNNTQHPKQLDYLLVVDMCHHSNLTNSEYQWLL